MDKSKQEYADSLMPARGMPNFIFAGLLRDLLDNGTDEEISEMLCGIDADTAREYYRCYLLCHMPLWGSQELVQAIGDDDIWPREIVLRAVELAQKANRLPEAFTPEEGVKWGIANGYIARRFMLRLLDMPHPTYPAPGSRVEAPTAPEASQPMATPEPKGKAPETAEKHAPLQRAQEDAILGAISDLGYTPDALPSQLPGKSGVKAEVRKKLKSHPLFKEKSTVFDKAWERLREFGDIADE